MRRDLVPLFADPARHCAKWIGAWNAKEVQIKHENGLWHVSARCRAEPEGTPQGGYVKLANAVRRTQELAGLTDDEANALTGEAGKDGLASRACPGKAM